MTDGYRGGLSITLKNMVSIQKVLTGGCRYSNHPTRIKLKRGFIVLMRASFLALVQDLISFSLRMAKFML